MKPCATSILMRSVLVCAIIILTGRLANAQDGICKNGHIPTNFVVVEELNTPDCDDGIDPFALNTVRVQPVEDGITACSIPGFDSIGPQVAEMVICGTKESNKCAARLDGLPNGLVLQSPTSCAKGKLPKDLILVCNPHSTPAFGVNGYYMVAEMSPDLCPAVPTGQIRDDKPWLARKVSDTESMVSVCADDSNYGPGDIVVRRFHNSNCPENSHIAGSQEGLTGWILLRNPALPEGTVLDVCVIATPQVGEPFGQSLMVAHPASKHSSYCGGSDQGLNSFEIRFGPDHTILSDVAPPCLVGTWFEQPDRKFWWTVELLNGKLMINRSDKVTGGVFTKNGMNWVGQIRRAATVTDNVVLSPTESCMEIRTNLPWWLINSSVPILVVH